MFDKYKIKQTVVAIGAGSTPIVAANAFRKYLSFMVVGTQDVTIVPDDPAVVGAGMIYQGSGANKQGGFEEFPGGAPTNAFNGIAAGAGSSVIVWEA